MTHPPARELIASGGICLVMQPFVDQCAQFERHVVALPARQLHGYVGDAGLDHVICIHRQSSFRSRPMAPFMSCHESAGFSSNSVRLHSTRSIELKFPESIHITHG
ncbi:MAG: hypothetical protein ACREO7_12945 [Pseudoxanthomonas sp.]